MPRRFHNANGSGAHIGVLVEDAWQRCGVGAALVCAAVAHARRLGLTHLHADVLAVELPYGRKRALEIATTLALDPELLLLDEPTNGMGNEDVGRVMDLIKRVSASRTVLMVEHNMNVVSRIADRITVLQRGTTLAEGTYAEVSRDRRVIEAYIGTAH